MILPVVSIALFMSVIFVFLSSARLRFLATSLAPSLIGFLLSVMVLLIICQISFDNILLGVTHDGGTDNSAFTKKLPKNTKSQTIYIYINNFFMRNA